MRWFGVILRNSGLNWSPAPILTGITRYSSPSSSSAICTLWPFGVGQLHSSSIALSAPWRLSRPVLVRQTPAMASAPGGAAHTCLPPAEQALDIAEGEFDVGRAAVVALAAVRRRLHLAQERVHLVARQAVAGAHARMAGQGPADALDPL